MNNSKIFHKENGHIKLVPGTLAHRVGAIGLYYNKNNYEREKKPFLKSLIKKGLGKFTYLNITDLNGVNGSVNDAINGYGKSGLDINTEYGRKKFSIIFSNDLNKKLRNRDKISDKNLDTIVEKAWKKLNNSKNFELEVKDFLFKEFKNTGIAFRPNVHDDALIGLLAIQMYNKFKEKEKTFRKYKKLIDSIYDSLWGIKTYSLLKTRNGKYSVDTFELTKKYFAAFLFCTQIRKPRVKTNLNPKLIEEIENIPVYLL